MLSWRKLPTQSEIIARIHKFILNLDTDGSTAVQIAQSKGKHAVRFEDVMYGEDTVPMLLRYDQPIKRQVVRDRVSQRQWTTS